MSRLRGRLIFWIRMATVANCIFCWSHPALAAIQGGNSQEGFNATIARGLADLERRVGVIEIADVTGRLRVLESDMAEVKWLARGASGAVAGQLLIAGLGRRRQQRLEFDREE